MSSFKKYIWPALSLSIICIVVAGLLAVTNNFTKDIIKQNEIDAANEAKLVVLPDADGFEVIDFTKEDGEKYGIVDIVSAKNGVGTVITISSDGYHGKVPVMVGFGKDGNITRIKVMENTETAGLGKRIEEESFWGQFNGLGEDISSVNPISGASVSSNSVKSSVEKAFEVLKIVKGGK